MVYLTQLITNTPMKKLIYLWLVTLIALSPGIRIAAQTSQIIYVPKPGTLAEMVSAENAKAITHLTLQGRLNAIDFRQLRDSFTNLRVLDLSGTSIKRYAGKRGTCAGQFCIYPANNIPAYAFCTLKEDSTFTGKSSLRNIILPARIKKIGNAAFKGCINLDICQIREKEPPRLMPEALADSLTAIFVPTGKSDVYRNESEWKNFALIEGEPISRVIRISETSSLAEELQRRRIQPRDINFLTIKGKLDEEDFALIRDYMPRLVSINLQESNAAAIPEYTFSQKKILLKVILPRGLKSIGQRAFSGCTRLAGTLMLPPDVTAIEYGAFMDCKNLNRVLATGNKLTTLGDKLFEGSPGKLVNP